MPRTRRVWTKEMDEALAQLQLQYGLDAWGAIAAAAQGSAELTGFNQASLRGHATRVPAYQATLRAAFERAGRDLAAETRELEAAARTLGHAAVAPRLEPTIIDEQPGATATPPHAVLMSMSAAELAYVRATVVTIPRMKRKIEMLEAQVAALAGKNFEKKKKKMSGKMFRKMLKQA